MDQAEEASNSTDATVKRTKALMRLGRVVGAFAGPAGAVAMELLDAVVAPTIERRTTEWMEAVAEKLLELERRLDGFQIEALAQDERFVSVLLRAGQAVLRTHEPTKRELLRNAVVNAARGIDIDHDLQDVFVRFLDELGILHVTILQYVRDHPEKFARFDEMSSYKLFRRRYLEDYNHIGATPDEFEVAVRELSNRGLLRVSERVSSYGRVFRYMQPRVEGPPSPGQSVGWSDGPMVEVSGAGQLFLVYIMDADSEQAVPSSSA